MKSLFETLTEISLQDDMSIHFKILNIEKGWELIDKLKCDDQTKNKLVHYVCYAYSFESKLLKKRRDRFECKKAICDFLDLYIDSFVLKCLQNTDSDFGKYVTWWLRENRDRDSAILISLEDALFQLLELSRQGIDFTVTASSAKDTERALKIFAKTEVLIKGDALKKAMEIKQQIESLQSKLEKNYEYLYKTVREESEDLAQNLNWAEKMVLRKRNQ